VAVAVAPAKEFIGCVLELGCVRLLHYMGSSGHIADLLSRCFAAGIGLVADGEGNVLAYVGEEAEVAPTAQVLVRASTRYSGQTCTSINGVVAHPAVYEGLRDLVQSELASLRCGDPRAEDVKVGPLFEVAQVRSCLERMEHSEGHILVGGRAEGTLLLPSLVDRPNPACDLVREGLFGPALWIMPGDAGVFREIWQLNRYPLAAAVFGRSDWAPTLPNLARLTVDGDPSFEYGHAPWGGYPSAGVNPVGPWIDKYLRAVQVDRPAREAL
ncbi:MAG TPA: aldehyde dehydrogenase family protein, partial [Fimbriimonadaceae bacterium]|nr:aldehyde dehydrogenase family protein [Fimbriimonadaceae bacterium]